MSNPDVTGLIEKAKTGDQGAKNTIIKLMQDNGYMRAISHYLYLNRLVEPDDVRSEFWLGVILALPKVSPIIGDPLFYLAWQGANRVKKQLRNKIGKGVQFTCKECGYKGRFDYRQKTFKCKDCGSINYESYQKEVALSIICPTPEMRIRIIDLLISTKPKQLEVDDKIDLEYIKTQLAPRERQVFTLIVEDGISREYEQNYLKTISEIMGISAQCVNLYLQRIKKKLLKIQSEI